MAMIVRKGTVPSTPHTEFYAIPNVLAREEIHGSYGFSGAWSRKLHVRFYPTEQVKPPRKGEFDLVPEFPAEADVLQPYHIFTGRIPFEGDALSSRKPIVHGPRTSISVSKPTKSMPPVVEAEIETPELPPYKDARGEFAIDVKHSGEKITRIRLGHPPFDLAGGEGALYPFFSDIKTHHGIAGEIHTAPPMHQTF